MRVQSVFVTSEQNKKPVKRHGFGNENKELCTRLKDKQEYSQSKVILNLEPEAKGLTKNYNKGGIACVAKDMNTVFNKSYNNALASVAILPYTTYDNLPDLYPNRRNGKVNLKETKNGVLFYDFNDKKVKKIERDFQENNSKGFYFILGEENNAVIENIEKLKNNSQTFEKFKKSKDFEDFKKSVGSSILFIEPVKGADGRVNEYKTGNNKFEIVESDYQLFKLKDDDQHVGGVGGENRAYFMYTPNMSRATNPYGDNGAYNAGDPLKPANDFDCKSNVEAIVDVLYKLNKQNGDIKINPGNILLHDRFSTVLIPEILYRATDTKNADEKDYYSRLLQNLRVHAIQHNIGRAYQGVHQGLEALLLVAPSELLREKYKEPLKEFCRRLNGEEPTVEKLKQYDPSQNKSLYKLYEQYVTPYLDDKGTFNLSQIPIAAAQSNSAIFSYGTVSENYGEEICNLEEPAKGLKNGLARNRDKANNITNSYDYREMNAANYKGSFGPKGSTLGKNNLNNDDVKNSGHIAYKVLQNVDFQTEKIEIEISKGYLPLAKVVDNIDEFFAEKKQDKVYKKVQLAENKGKAVVKLKDDGFEEVVATDLKYLYNAKQNNKSILFSQMKKALNDDEREKNVVSALRPDGKIDTNKINKSKFNQLFFSENNFNNRNFIMGTLKENKLNDDSVLYVGWGRGCEQKGYVTSLQAVLNYLKDKSINEDQKKKCIFLFGGDWAITQKQLSDQSTLPDDFKEMMRIINEIEKLDSGAYAGQVAYINGWFANGLVKCADYSLFTSRTEPCGLTPLESQCCGAPVLSTKTGGAPNLIIDKVNGFLTKHPFMIEKSDTEELYDYLVKHDRNGLLSSSKIGKDDFKENLEYLKKKLTDLQVFKNPKALDLYISYLTDGIANFYDGKKIEKLIDQLNDEKTVPAQKATIEKQIDKIRIDIQAREIKYCINDSADIFINDNKQYKTMQEMSINNNCSWEQNANVEYFQKVFGFKINENEKKVKDLFNNLNIAIKESGNLTEVLQDSIKDNQIDKTKFCQNYINNVRKITKLYANKSTKDEEQQAISTAYNACMKFNHFLTNKEVWSDFEREPIKPELKNITSDISKENIEKKSLMTNLKDICKELSTTSKVVVSTCVAGLGLLMTFITISVIKQLVDNKKPEKSVDYIS